MLVDWFNSIKWTVVAAWSLWWVTIAGIFAAFILEGDYKFWFFSMLLTLILTRIENIWHKVNNVDED